MSISENNNRVEPSLSDLVQSAGKYQTPDGCVALDHYICIVSELANLFKLFGKGMSLSLFSAEKALKSLQVRRVMSTHSASVELLLHSEQQNMGANVQKTLEDNLLSGTKALCRLNLMLDFMVNFLAGVELAFVEEREFTPLERIKIYQNTCSSIHPVMVKGAVKVMLLQSPGKQRLIEAIGPYCPADRIPRVFIQHLVKSVRPMQEKVARALQAHTGDVC